MMWLYTSKAQESHFKSVIIPVPGCIVSSQNSYLRRTCECDLSWKQGLCRCIELKWGHTRLRYALAQWLILLRRGKYGPRHPEGG